jgi:hypothetical protein
MPTIHEIEAWLERHCWYPIGATTTFTMWATPYNGALTVEVPLNGQPATPEDLGRLLAEITVKADGEPTRSQVVAEMTGAYHDIGCARPAPAGPLQREELGRIVRDTWVQWALTHPEPKRSWLVPWDHLEPGQREVDMLIGDAVAAAVYQRLALIGMTLNGPRLHPGPGTGH